MGAGTTGLAQRAELEQRIWLQPSFEMVDNSYLRQCRWAILLIRKDWIIRYVIRHVQAIRNLPLAKNARDRGEKQSLPVNERVQSW